MALNENIEKKLAEKTADKKAIYEAMIHLLQGVDEGKQLKRLLEPILKTI